MEKKIFALIIFAILIVAVPSYSYAAEQVTVIFTTTDVHGHVYEVPEKGEIGYALLKKYIDSTKADQKILIDTGDNLAGNSITRLEFGHFAAQLMGMMGYEMMTIGNHEFDFNSVIINRKPAGDEHIAALVSTVREYNKNFQALAANLYHKDTKSGKLVPVSEWDNAFAKVIIRDIKGFPKNAKDANGNPIGKIVFVGATTDEIKTLRKTASENVANFETDNLAKTIELLESVANAYSGDDNIVVAALHLGMPEELTATLLRNKNIDFMLDGHSHIKSSEIINNDNSELERAYINNGYHLKSFSEITIRADNGKVIKTEARQNDYEFISSLGLVPDQKMENAIADVRKGFPLFEMWDSFMPSETYNVETALGRILAKALAEATRADVGILNTGGIRAGLNKGAVYMLDIYDIYPFINTAVVAEMTGGELEKMILDAYNRGKNAFPNIYGVRVSFSPDGQNAEKVAGIKHDKIYRVAMNDFMAKGGDYYPIQKNTLIECWLDGKTKQTNNCDFAETIVSSFKRHGKDFFIDTEKISTIIK